MLSKGKLKYIRSLELKKNRKEELAFVAEGPKVVGDLFGHFPCKLLVATGKWLATQKNIQANEIIEVTADELSRASFLKTPQDVLAVFSYTEYTYDIASIISDELCLALDDVQDPGNLGTIIRLADWFGIKHIFCSPGTVDIYNPKVIQATMGAVARVQLHYTPLPEVLICASKHNIPRYGTFLDGTNIYEESLSVNGIIVMGNEGKGIGAKVEQYVSHRLYIPNYPVGNKTSESLNVAIATAITCAEFRRRLL